MRDCLNEQIEDNIKVEWKDGLDFCGSGYGRIVDLVIRVHKISDISWIMRNYEI